MFWKRLNTNILVFLLLSLNTPAYTEQKIKDFYLSNFEQGGARKWEMKGNEALIYDEYVDIDKMEANYFLEEDTILITSDEARLDKKNLDIYLKENVRVKNKDGATLSTDSLNWQREKNRIETDDWVQTNKDSMKITAKGLSADTQLKKADFEKDVEVTLPDEASDTITTITCSGPLEIEYDSGTAIFNKDVVATHPQGKMFSDKATLFFDTKEKSIIKIVSEGNVKITRDNNVTFAQKATYFAKERKIVLEGRPRVIYYPQEGEELGFH